MNKEVIYLEPEDDITDILTKLQRADQKLVVLVPPKKAAILRSAVNIKLIAKACKESKKVPVIVTQDLGIMKLAMGSKIMVAKSLQSRPAVPVEEDFKDFHKKQETQIIDDGLGTATVGDALQDLDKTKDNHGASKDPAANSKDSAKTSAEESESDDAKKAKHDKKSPKEKKSPKLTKLQKCIAIGSVAGVLIICLLVWALVFAPAVAIAVTIRATSSNIAESVSFTENIAEENISEGKFFAEKQTYETKLSKEIKPTGTKNIGEKASGKVEVKFSFKPYDYVGTGYEASIPVGAKFTNGSREYIATTSASNSWDGDGISITCDNGAVTSLRRNCDFTLTVSVEAAEPGEEYDIAAAGSSNNVWSDYGEASVTNTSAITGGTSKEITVLSQNDVNGAKIALEEQAANDDAGKERLYKEFGDDVITIDDSYKRDVGQIKVQPDVDAEMKEDETAKAEMIITYSVYTIDKTKVEEFIKSKTTLADDQKIYTYGKPYFERYMDLNSPARLKTVIETGPIVNEDIIMEKAKGRKIGEVQSLLRSINGVSSVEITPSYFWVSSVPNDPNKIKIELKTEEE